jgi:hypothetical protein
MFVARIYDPPEGWRFGFPKPWPSALPTTTDNLAAQLKADGYPDHAIPVALDHTRFIGDYMTYKEWMIEVDRLLEKRTGLVQEELPDWLSRDSFEKGMTPQEGADECLLSVGWEPDEEIDEP